MPSNIKVLLVDDNPMVLEMLRQALAQFSSVSTLTDGADAMLRAIDDKPDLIISDYSMQALDGKQLVQKLKGRSTTANIPVILMASKTDITEKLKVLQDTVEDFIEKPFFLKEAAGLGTGMSGKILTYKALTAEFRTARLPKDPACPLCSAHSAIRDLSGHL